MSKQKKVLFIVGSTASGKSKLSYDFVNKYGGVVVNCDSLQVYESLNIGSAKPSPEEMKKCPHYLFGHIKNGEEYTAGKFRKDALDLLQKSNHTLFIFVGGSGFYIKALVMGMFEETPIKQEIKEQVKLKRKELGKEGLYLYLKEIDPNYAKSIHQNDTYRVSRALELVLSLGKTMEKLSAEFEQKPSDFAYPYMYLGVKVERPELKKRIEQRLENMLEIGFREEVENLVSKNLKAWKPLQSVGYKEMLSLIEGEIEEPLFKEEVIKNTMRLAKRQMTWFKRNKNIFWVNGENLSLDPFANILHEFLSR